MLDDALDNNLWTGTEMAATIVAASIPVLRGFFKEKAATAFRRKGRSDGSGEPTAAGARRSVAKQNIRLSSKTATGTSASSQSRTYLELDDLDLEGAYPVR